MTRLLRGWGFHLGRRMTPIYGGHWERGLPVGQIKRRYCLARLTKGGGEQLAAGRQFRGLGLGPHSLQSSWGKLTN